MWMGGQGWKLGEWNRSCLVCAEVCDRAVLFVFMDRVPREAKRQFQSEVRLSTANIGLLLFADDMVVMSELVEGALE